MEIQLVKKESRNRLICKRKDGTMEVADLGPGLPLHDIAHYVVEKKLNIKRCFFGNIREGYPVSQLSQKETIQILPAESMVSEVVTRALQSLSSGACTIDQFKELIMQEIELQGIHYSLHLTPGDIEDMLQEYQQLLKQWKELREGESIALELKLE